MESLPLAVTRDFVLHAGMPARALGNALMTTTALRDAAILAADERAERLKVSRVILCALHVLAIIVPDALGPL